MPQSSTAPEPWRILLIADASVSDQSLVDAFAAAGITPDLDRAPSLRDALERLQSCRWHRQGERPSLILLQVDLGDGRGYDLLEHIKRTTDLESVPLLALSASDALSNRGRAARAGAAGFVTIGALGAELPRSLDQLIARLSDEPSLERRKQLPAGPAPQARPRRSPQENRSYWDSVQQLVKESDPMRAVIDRVDPRIIFWLCLTTAVGTAPFLISHIINGNVFMLGIIGSLQLMLLAVIWECWKTKRAPVRGLIVGTMVGAVVVFLAGVHLEAPGVIWAYPYIGFAYYFVGYRRANWIVAAFVPAVAAGAYTWADPGHFSRIVVTLAMTWMFCVVFSVNNERQRQELARMAGSDPLTGAANRREMYLELGRAAQQNERHGSPATVIMLDIDHFKAINDNHGHDVGDAVLVDLVQLLARRLRKTDRLFRIGGEEFVVLLSLTAADDALTVAESLRRTVENTRLGGLKDVTISSGVAELAMDEEVAGWLKRADEALYRAKAQGRNRVEPAARKAA